MLPLTMIDLHTHTNHSDGTLTPIEILKRAQARNLTHLSITDHNNVDAYFAIGNYQDHFTGKLINGIEMACFYRGREIEILGYDFDLNKIKELLHGVYMTHDQVMTIKAKKIYNALIKNNVRLSPDTKPENFDTAKDYYPSKYFWQDITKYPENKQIITDQDAWNNSVMWYRHYFANPHSPFFIGEDNFYPSVETVINIIKQSGGKTFIPHIFTYRDNALEYLTGLTREFQIDGIECYYFKHTPEQIEYLLNFCKENNLLISAGSDFHGKAGYPDDVGTNTTADMTGWLN